MIIVEMWPEYLACIQCHLTTDLSGTSIVRTVGCPVYTMLHMSLFQRVQLCTDQCEGFHMGQINCVLLKEVGAFPRCSLVELPQCYCLGECWGKRHRQWNLYNPDTLGTTKSVLITEVSWLSRVAPNLSFMCV